MPNNNKLVTKKLEKLFSKYPLYSQDGIPCEKKKVLVKYFGGSSYTCLVYEAKLLDDGDWLFFANITFDGYEWELGYVQLSQLSDVRFPPFGLPIERDLYF